jgi:hypothetical protein
MTKPHPLPYREALRFVGADAARSADLAVIGVTTSLDAQTVISLGAGIAARNFSEPAVIKAVKLRTEARPA